MNSKSGIKLLLIVTPSLIFAYRRYKAINQKEKIIPTPVEVIEFPETDSDVSSTEYVGNNTTQTKLSI